MNQKGFAPLLLLLGLVIVGVIGFFVYTKFFKPVNPQSASDSVTPLFLTLNSPTADTQATNDKVVVKGKTLPNTTVVLFNETDEATLDSNAKGEFEGTLLLSEGENNLIITAFAENGEEKTLNLTVDYDGEG
jgi:hypothetical protein